jgi:hypothetical protein
LLESLENVHRRKYRRPATLRTGMNGIRTRRLAVASAGLSLTIGAVALAAPDRSTDLGGSKTTYEWDGTASGGDAGVNSDVDDTQVKLSEGGTLAINLSKFTEATGLTGADFDIRLYKADANGDPTGDALGEAITSDSEKESLTVKNLKAGAYVIEVNGYLTFQGTFHGKATFSGTGGGTATPGPSGPTGPSGPSGPSGPTGPVGTTDATPDATVKKPAKKPKKFAGTATDDKGVAKVQIALQSKKGKKCKQLKKSGKFAKLAKCDAPTSWLLAKGTTKWSFKLKRKLKKGSYTVFARATDSAGQVQAGFTPANKRKFKVKK